MATLAQKIAAEHEMCELLRENGMPPPDAVEYGHRCIRLFFYEPKAVVVVDIDEPPAGSPDVWEEEEPG
jgi:hypothetical protein